MHRNSPFQSFILNTSEPLCWPLKFMISHGWYNLLYSSVHTQVNDSAVPEFFGTPWTHASKSSSELCVLCWQSSPTYYSLLHGAQQTGVSPFVATDSFPQGLPRSFNGYYPQGSELLPLAGAKAKPCMKTSSLSKDTSLMTRFQFPYQLRTSQKHSN